jgi:hypothetical protein
MKARLRRCSLGRLLSLAVIITLMPLPALADDEPGQEIRAPGIRASAASISKSQPLAATRSAAVQSARPEGPDSPSFFRKPVGILVLATMAAGVGYAIYSTQNDRITSPAKQQ